MRALGYVRVSTADQGVSGAGLEAQRTAIINEADRRLWDLGHVHTDVASGASTKKRPELAEALGKLERGEADALIVARLSRLARSTKDILRFIELADRQGWELIPLDYPQFDTSKAIGKLLVTIVAAVDEFQRELIGENTSEALRALQAQGVYIGRPRVLDEAVARRIQLRYRNGESYSSIAKILNIEGVPTATGKQWGHSNVRAVVKRKQHANGPL